MACCVVGANECGLLLGRTFLRQSLFEGAGAGLGNVSPNDSNGDYQEFIRKVLVDTNSGGYFSDDLRWEINCILCDIFLDPRDSFKSRKLIQYPPTKCVGVREIYSAYILLLRPNQILP